VGKRLVADFPKVPDYRWDLAGSYRVRGDLARAAARLTEADDAYREALKLYDQLAADFPRVPDYRYKLAGAYFTRGNLLRDTDRLPEAEAAWGKALGISRKLAEEFPKSPQYRQDLAGGYTNRGVVLHQRGRYPEALRDYREALEVRGKLAADFPRFPGYRRDLANTYTNLGNLYTAQREWAQAEKAFGQALAIRRRLAADFPRIPLLRADVAQSHGNQGYLRQVQQRWGEAEAEYREGLALYQKLAADFPGQPDYQERVAAFLVSVGQARLEQDDAEAALGWFTKASALLRPLHARQPRLGRVVTGLRNAYFHRADALDRLERYPEALADWDRVLELRVGDRAYDRLRRARVLALTGKVAEAVAEATAVAGAKGVTADRLYQSACVLARASAAEKDRGRAESHAAGAVALLGKAGATGFFREPAKAALLQEVADLEPLRRRDDFRKLVQSLKGEVPRSGKRPD
jgi:tetratricopeptide (TPR) repeat protein